jgi:hypothetical protein
MSWKVLLAFLILRTAHSAAILRSDFSRVQMDFIRTQRIIRKVEFVITNGTLYNGAELWRSVGFKP